MTQPVAEPKTTNSTEAAYQNKYMDLDKSIREKDKELNGKVGKDVDFRFFDSRDDTVGKPLSGFLLREEPATADISEVPTMGGARTIYHPFILPVMVFLLPSYLTIFTRPLLK